MTQRPLPAPDNVSAEYWAAAAQGRLLIQHCERCGRRQFYPRALCTACGATPSWERASGVGTVHTYTVIRQNGAPPFDQMAPYVVAMVELEEGVRMMSNITDCDVDEVHVGMPVEVHFEAVDEAVAIPLFRPRR